MGLELHVVVTGETDKGTIIKPGMVVEYLGHIYGGNVAIRLNGEQEITHPYCFEELR